MRNIYLSFALLLFALMVMSPSARAQLPGSVLIWPVNPVIAADKKAAALWLENPGTSPVTLQVRIYAWEQAEGKNVYAAQDAVVGTPPIVTIAPGTKQLVRLTRMGSAPARTETPYRVIVDEIPSAAGLDAAPGPAISFRMRYSIPLFVMGPATQGSTAALQPKLAWRIVAQGGERFVEVRNVGPVHARLTAAVIGGRTSLGEGLLGYVLPDRAMRWPLPPGASTDDFSVSVNGLAAVTLDRTVE
jgi:fimbrial chaperone protein